MKTLLLIPSVLKRDIEGAVRDDQHPTMDYHALSAALRTAGGEPELLGYTEADADTDPRVRAAHRVGGRDAALAMMGFLRRNRYDAIFTNGENVAIPLALLLKGRRRPGHVTIGHRPSTGKKHLFFRHLRVDNQIDTMFVYATSQLDFARTRLGIAPERLSLMHFHADDRFFRRCPEIAESPDQLCAAGLEWRDYPTLLAAVETMPEITVKLAASSPWSKHQNETEKRSLPANVTARRYDYRELRELYARSAIVAVPLYENDFQAGVTTLLEAMAMGKAVIVTGTSGQTDVVTDGVNGLVVAPGDIEGWRRAIVRLRQDSSLRQRLGDNASEWIYENARLDRWVRDIVVALHDATGIPARLSASMPIAGTPSRSYTS